MKLSILAIALLLTSCITYKSGECNGKSEDLDGVSIKIDNRKTVADLKVGDCVRELGYDSVETLTAVADGGAIETQHINKYYNSNPPKTRVDVYDKHEQERLVKVKCN